MTTVIRNSNDETPQTFRRDLHGCRHPRVPGEEKLRRLDSAGNWLVATLPVAASETVCGLFTECQRLHAGSRLWGCLPAPLKQLVGVVEVSRKQTATDHAAWRRSLRYRKEP